MVIQKFNKLIRNKWFWGAFAVLISAAFCFDDMFTSRRQEERSVGDAGLLGGESVNAKEFLAIAEDVRGFGRNRDWHRNAGEVNRIAWENYAALRVANKDGIDATDAEVQAQIRGDSSFQQNGKFSFELYQRLLRENSIVPERFEEYLKRRTTLMRIGQAVLGGASWASPMELDQAIADMTDSFTVKVARFSQDAKEANAVKVDDAALRKWYNDNTNSLALPERIKIRYVKFDATKKDILAKMTVSEEEIRDRFDVTADKYVTKDTNGVESVKKFDELTKAEKDGIEQDLRRIAAVQFFETNLNNRVYAVKAAKGSSRLDEIAKEDGLKVETSDWFSISGSYQEGFMRYTGSICPGAQGFTEAVAELDSSSEDLRYAVVCSERMVWLIEKAQTSAKHLPSFDEAKEVIRPRVLRAAKADAFKASVEAIAKKGVKAILETKNVSSNLTFTVSDLKSGDFADQMAIARASMKLKKGEVSEFTLTSPGHGLLVVCENRVAGDTAKAMVLRSQVQNDLQMIQMRQIPEVWQKWNLDRIGFEPGEVSSTSIVEEAE